MTDGRRGVLIQLLQYLLGVVALWWLLRQGRWSEFTGLLASLPASVLVTLLVVTVVGLCFRFYTWNVLLVEAGNGSFRAAAEIDLVVNFINNLFPSRLSGRAAAPFVVRDRSGLDIGTSVAVTGVNTGLYAVLYAVAALAGVAALVDRVSVGIVALLLLSSLLYLAAGVTILLAGLRMDLLDGVLGWFESRLERVPFVGARLTGLLAKAPEYTGRSADFFAQATGSPRTVIGYSLGFLGAAVVFPAVRVWILFDTFGASIEPLVLLPVFLVAAYSVTLLPLTPGGIGITEATATVVFAALGVPASIAASTILVDRVLGVYFPALVGWLPSIDVDLTSRSSE